MKEKLKWMPKIKLEEGLRRTIEWYFSTKDPEEIKKNSIIYFLKELVPHRLITDLDINDGHDCGAALIRDGKVLAAYKKKDYQIEWAYKKLNNV